MEKTQGLKENKIRSPGNKQYHPANSGSNTKVIRSVKNLEEPGLWLDSTTCRDDYRCQATFRTRFFCLDEKINTAAYLVLLEIDGNTLSCEL